MKKNLMWLFMSMGLIVMLFAPALSRADGINLSVNVGVDDEAHFHFKDRGHIHPMIWKAAQQLRNAKHTLWAAADDFGGHKLQAIQAINGALDELRQSVEFANSKK